MSKKRINLIISILNIISVLIVLIFGNIIFKGIIKNGGILALIATMDNYNALVIRNYNIIMVVLWGVTIAVNAVCGIQNSDNKKLSVCYLMLAILQIINIIGLILFKVQLWNIIGIVQLIIIIIQIMDIHKQNSLINMSHSSNIIVYFVIYALTVIILLVINIIFLIKYTSLYSQRKAELNEIKDEISTSTAYSVTQEYIQVSKERKSWIY